MNFFTSAADKKNVFCYEVSVGSTFPHVGSLGWPKIRGFCRVTYVFYLHNELYFGIRVGGSKCELKTGVAYVFLVYCGSVAEIPNYFSLGQPTITITICKGLPGFPKHGWPCFALSEARLYLQTPISDRPDPS